MIIDLVCQRLLEKMGGADTLRNGDSGSVLREYHAGMDKEIRFSSELKRKPQRSFVQKSNII